MSAASSRVIAASCAAMAIVLKLFPVREREKPLPSKNPALEQAVCNKSAPGGHDAQPVAMCAGEAGCAAWYVWPPTLTASVRLTSANTACVMERRAVSSQDRVRVKTLVRLG